VITPCLPRSCQCLARLRLAVGVLVVLGLVGCAGQSPGASYYVGFDAGHREGVNLHERGGDPETRSTDETQQFCRRSASSFGSAFEGEPVTFEPFDGSDLIIDRSFRDDAYREGCADGLLNGILGD
jgi:hypothetical protein